MSVTEKDMSGPFKCIEFVNDKAVYKLKHEDISQFLNQDKVLAKKIANIKIKYELENNLKPTKAYESLEDKCQIAITTLKNTMTLKITPTRNFLYKFTVGLKMDKVAANELFELCGGKLRDDCMADVICQHALKSESNQGDNIHDFIAEFEKYTKSKIALRDRNPNKDTEKRL